VDFLVTAGYNPLALITFLHKSEPQKRFDRFSAHNLTSKRLANIYEYIYKRYPSYLVNNEYINDETYQHFLLSSVENRRKLYKHISTKSKGKVDYE
jgi:predicted Zn-dependent protease